MQITDRPKVAVITGASSGIGLVAAKALAAQGWRIIGQGRDPGRIAAAEAQIRAAAQPGVPVDMIRADLSLVSDSVRLAEEIAARTDRVDVLMNNAGGAAKAQEITAEGNEATFASNHLGHFVMTQRLLPLLQAAAAEAPAGDVRILNVSSKAHEPVTALDWDDLQMLDNFVPIVAYCRVKLANIFFTRALADRLAGEGIVAHAIHPGAVATNFVDRADEDTQRHMRTHGLLTPEEGADTLIWLATAPEAGQISGLYWSERQAVPTTAYAQDAEAPERLWRDSEKLAAASLKASERVGA